MQADCLPFKETGYFSKLICDYLDKKEVLKPFYNRFPELDNFKNQIAEKKENYSFSNRKILSDEISNQYKGFSISEETEKNISYLKSENTFTIVTGHQLNLFTGPLYFLYKIISTINLAKELQEEYTDYNFVPVYWMATEDHDFDEINFFNFQGKKIRWNSDQTGAVGRFKTHELHTISKLISAQFGDSDHANYLKNLFEEAYLQHENLAQATRFIVNQLFGEYGLVIVDGDAVALKRLLVPYVKKDIFENIPYSEITNSNKKLSDEGYKVQVNPREINYFYLKDGLRERIVFKDGSYVINETNISFSKAQLEDEIENHPDRFSPNVIARPLFQEVILPNLCYIGGGGELAYWLELKNYFDAFKITFPILLVRNSALIISEKQAGKIDRLDLSVKDLFLDQNQLINKKIRKISNINIDFSGQKKHLEEQFKSMYKLADQTDKSFFGAVKAQETKQLKGLENLEKRLLKAQRYKLKEHVLRITDIQNQLFPNQTLQERQLNFSEFYLQTGSDLIPYLVNILRPLQNNFLVSTL